MPWPDNTPPIPNANFNDDADTVTGGSGARIDLFGLIGKLNVALDSMPANSVPLTDQNSGNYVQAATGSTLNNEIATLTQLGHIKTSDTRIGTTLGTDDTTVPTSKAVQDAIAAIPANAEVIQKGWNNPGTRETWEITFPGGLIIQCGYEPNSSSSEIVTFLNYFPNAIFFGMGVAFRSGNTGGTARSLVMSAAPTVTGLSFSLESSDTRVYWLAVGN